MLGLMCALMLRQTATQAYPAYKLDSDPANASGVGVQLWYRMKTARCSLVRILLLDLINRAATNCSASGAILPDDTGHNGRESECNGDIH
jgi:hypothetical protein